jgi:FdhD protein
MKPIKSAFLVAAAALAMPLPLAAREKPGCMPQVQQGWIRLLPGGMPMHGGFARIENRCPAACEWRLKERRRSLAGRTGCGLCGTDSLAQVRRALPAVPVVALPPTALPRAQRELRALQAAQQLTGATHAAGWCSREGQVLLAREDIGRHNALDKLVGAMQRAGMSGSKAAEGFICITSRASFEMVQKAAAAGVGALAAVSAPTALAVDCAQACGMALAGFVRGDDFVAYTHPARLGLSPPANSAEPDHGH